MSLAFVAGRGVPRPRGALDRLLKSSLSCRLQNCRTRLAGDGGLSHQRSPFMAGSSLLYQWSHRWLTAGSAALQRVGSDVCGVAPQEVLVPAQ